MICKPLQADHWDALVAESPQGTIFSTTKWMKMFDQPYSLFGVYKGQELIGGWGGFQSPQPLTPFQSILVKEPKGMNYTSIMSRHIEVTKALMDVLPSEFYNHYTFPDIRPFKWAGGWQIDVKYTYVVDIKDSLQAVSNFEKDTRNAALKQNLLIAWASMAEFIPLYHTTFERKGLKPTASDDLLLSLEDTFRPLILRSGDTMAVAIQDNKRAYYILGASIAEGRTPYVLYNLFKASRGFEIDLCGANDERIALYKRGFGGILKSYFGVKRV